MSAANPPSFWRRMGAAFNVLRGVETTARWRSIFGTDAQRDKPTKPYRQVGVVFTCVQRKADALARMDLRVSTPDDEVIESGPLVTIGECPNPAMTWRGFIRATSAYLDLFGRCAWRVVAPVGPSPLVEVWTLMPARLSAERDDRSGELLGWTYRHAGGREERLTVEEVHYFNDPDFEGGDELSGLAPRVAVAMAIEQYFKSDLANLSSLDNGVEPGGALRVPGELSEAQ